MSSKFNSIPRRKQPATVRVATWSAQHRWTVFGLWFLFTIGLFVGSIALGGTKTESAAKMPSGYDRLESIKAWDLLDQNKTGEAEDQFILVIYNPNLKVTDPAYNKTVSEIYTTLSNVTYTENGQAIPVITKMVNPYLVPPEAGLVSPDQTAVRIMGTIKGNSEVIDQRIAPLKPVLKDIRSAYPGYEIHAFSNGLINSEMMESTGSDMDSSLKITVPLTFLILLVVFGAGVAAVVPLVLAITALLGAFGALGIYSQLVSPVSSYAGQVIVLVGMAVAVDYSLFMITRFRTERNSGRDKQQAIRIASSTAGRAVFFSGLTVAISLAGLYIINVSIFSSMATGTIAVVLISILGSLTFLPATLAILDNRINWLRLPLIGRQRGEGRGFWGAMARLVMRFPVLFLVVAAGIMLVMSVPVLGLKLGEPDLSSLPNKADSVKALNLMDQKWPQGVMMTAELVVTNADRPEVQAAIEQYKNAALQIKGLSQPVSTTLAANGTIETVSLVMGGSRNDPANHEIIKKLRNELVPAYFGNLGNTQAYITGMAAYSMDATRLYMDAMPVVFIFVLGLSFVLLLVAFHSIVIAIKAILMNLLSTGASYGVLVLVFQEGLFKDQLGFSHTGVIQDWIPVFIFTILFGLSMDYHLFLLTRIKEGYDQGMDTNTAVEKGISATSGTITSAAAIMVMVFGVFVTMQFVVIKQLGLGMAVAVFLDATIVRCMLVPSLMRLLGNWNWYMPRFLDWIPRVTIEAEEEKPEELEEVELPELAAEVA